MKTTGHKRLQLAITAITLGILTLLPHESAAQTITDGFTNLADWGAPFTESGKNLSLASGRLNFTSADSSGGTAAIPRTTPLLTTTQHWSVQVDAHLDNFTITSAEQSVTLFLGVGKTGDWFDTHVLLGFDRDDHFPDSFGMNDDFSVNGSSIDGFFNVNGIPSGDVAMRLEYNATAKTLTFSYDANGAAGGYAWTQLGVTNIASGPYDLQFGPADTFTILLAGWANLQTVTSGQAYFDNLEITVTSTDYAPDSIAGYTVVGIITNVNGANIPPTPGTNVYGVTTFSQIGPDANNTYSGTYSYTKTGADTGTIIIYKTAPPDQAGETTTNHLVFASPQAGTFAHYYDFIDTPPTVQYGTFQVMQTNGLTGSLQVTVSPAGAISAGAQWQVDGGAWQNSGNTVSNLTVGNHTVAYKTISGWNTPTNQTVLVAANTTTVTNGAYVQQAGSLLVTIDPASAVTAGAQWRVDGGAWQNSGAVVSGLSPGYHWVNFISISNWYALSDISVLVAVNSTATANGVYEPVGQPVISAPIQCALSGNSFTMSYPTVPGQVYILQYTDDLTSPVTWRALTPFIGTGSGFNIAVPAALPTRYFRVRVGGGDFYGAVYSINIVGYVRRSIQPGLNLVANPLNSCSDNSIASLFPSCPPNSEILLPVPNGSLFPGSVFTGGVWDQPNLTVTPGQGIGFWNPAAAFEVTFAGEVSQGALNSIPPGLSLVSSILPVNGLLNFPAQEGDEITTWNATNQTSLPHEYWGGGWQPVAPAIRPAEAFWVQVSQFTQWTQPFEWWTDLEVWESPVITRQPEDLTTAPGNTAHFTVQTLGGWPLNFQWRKDGTNLLTSERILGADTYTLAITNVQPGDAGDYSVVLTNSYGSVTSSIATLTVQAPPLLIVSTNSSFGVSNGIFGFILSGSPGQTVVTEVSTNLSVWQPLQTNVLTTGSVYFSDPQWMNYPNRYYRVRSP